MLPGPSCLLSGFQPIVAAPLFLSIRDMSRTHCFRLAIAGVTALASAGCYTYAPLTLAEVTPGRTVRVTLDDHGTAELSQWIGARGASLEGRVQSVTDTSMILAVTDVVRLNGATEPWTDESVSIPRRLAESIGVRRLNRQRTVLTSIGALAAAFAANSLLGNGGGLFGIGGRNSSARR